MIKKRFIGFLIIYRDITQEKRISNDRLQKRFETIQDALQRNSACEKDNWTTYMKLLILLVGSDSLAKYAKLIVSALCLLTGGEMRWSSDKRLVNGDRRTLKLKACFGVTQKWLTKVKSNSKKLLCRKMLLKSKH